MSLKHNLPHDYDSLVKDNISLKRELEENIQISHDTKRQLKVLEALQNEYLQEIELLKFDQKQDKNKFLIKISQLEENLVQVKVACSERNNDYEQELIDKDHKIEELLKEIDVLKKIQGEVPDDAENAKLLTEIINLREENLTLQDNCEELSVTLEKFSNEMVNLEDKVLNISAELENVKETLECKRSELNEAKEMIQTLNDDLICTKSELNILKSKPLDDATRGNSLFAEVDDRRVYLQKTINSMKPKFNKMKQEHAMQLAEINKLRNENLMLCQQLQSHMMEQQEDANLLDSMYSTRVKQLEEQVQALEKKLREHERSDESKPQVELNFFQLKLAEKSKEIKTLEDRLSTNSISNILLSKTIAECNREKRNLEVEVRKKKYDIDVLKQKVFELEMKNTNCTLSNPLQSTDDQNRDINVEEKQTQQFEIQTNEVKSILKQPQKSEEETHVNFDEDNNGINISTNITYTRRSTREKKLVIDGASGEENIAVEVADCTNLEEKENKNEKTSEPKIHERATASLPLKKCDDTRKTVAFSENKNEKTEQKIDEMATGTVPLKKCNDTKKTVAFSECTVDVSRPPLRPRGKIVITPKPTFISSTRR